MTRKRIKIFFSIGYPMKFFSYFFGLILALIYLPFWAVVNCLKPLWISCKNLLQNTRNTTNFQQNLILYYVGCVTVVTLHLGLSLGYHFHHIWLLLIPLTLGYSMCLTLTKSSHFNSICDMLLCLRGIDSCQKTSQDPMEQSSMLQSDQLKPQTVKIVNPPPTSTSTQSALTLLGYY